MLLANSRPPLGVFAIKSHHLCVNLSSRKVVCCFSQKMERKLQGKNFCILCSHSVNDSLGMETLMASRKDRPITIKKLYYSSSERETAKLDLPPTLRELSGSSTKVVHGLAK